MKYLRIIQTIFLLNLVGIFIPLTNPLALTLSGQLEQQDLIESLTEKSQWICRAKVEKIKSFYKDFTGQETKPVFAKENKVIYSEVTFTNLENLKGELDPEFSVTRVGGCVSDRCLTISEQPELKAGDEVIVYLHQPGTSDLRLVDDSRGIVFVEKGMINDDRSTFETFEQQFFEMLEGNSL